MYKMNKLAIAVSIATIFGVAHMANAASTGTITFEGELTATTCKVTIDGSDADATVVLPTVGINSLDAPGEVTGRTGFNMALSECEGTLTTASAFFEAGSTVDTITGRLKNATGDGYATNVSLQLTDSSNADAVIKAGDTSQVVSTTYVDISSGTANLPYAVQYYAENATTAGAVAGSVTYSIQYK
jgi:major type 1 subunit fimbrin (pilin)